MLIHVQFKVKPIEGIDLSTKCPCILIPMKKNITSQDVVNYEDFRDENLTEKWLKHHVHILGSSVWLNELPDNITVDTSKFLAIVNIRIDSND